MRQADSWRGRWQSILSRILIMSDEASEKSLLSQLASDGEPRVLAFVNAHAMNLMVDNQSFFDALATADLVLRDGSGMSILLKHRGMSPGLNMNGTDFIPKLIEAFAGRRVALWGTSEPYLGAASTRCASRYGVDIVSSHHGFDDAAVYVALADTLQPDLIVLGMGMPKQEQVATMIRAAEIPALVVCGGAIIDFLGGKVSRSPKIFKRLGLEWLYRLVLEPRRLFHRYIIGNPVFLWRTFTL